MFERTANSVRGTTTFQGRHRWHVNTHSRTRTLGVFHGIAGTLSAQDKFEGVLQHIDSQGNIDIPNFMVTRGQHPVHLRSEFQAIVNGTNGDVQVERVTTRFLKTTVLARGEIAHHAGQEGKVASLALSVRDGGVQDVLRLFVRGATRRYTVSPAFALT